MAEGRVRMAPFGERFSYHVGDFADGEVPTDLPGTFDLVVSARAIHHLSSPNKAKLYAQVYSRLNDGGAFCNIDNMRPRDDYFRAVYRKLGPRSTRPPGMGGGNGGNGEASRSRGRADHLATRRRLRSRGLPVEEARAGADRGVQGVSQAKRF